MQRTLLTKDKKLLEPVLSGNWDELAQEILVKLEELEQAFESRANAFITKAGELKSVSREKRYLVKLEVRRLRRELRVTWKAWLALTKFAVERYQIKHAHSH
jgi:SHS2 domain-containing protein